VENGVRTTDLWVMSPSRPPLRHDASMHDDGERTDFFRKKICAPNGSMSSFWGHWGPIWVVLGHLGPQIEFSKFSVF
jgi:hypothetical protein